jgi:hypothetical protein
MALSVTGGKEVRAMVKYTIIRVYEVPADNPMEAANRMLEAMAFHVEKAFHVKDVMREPGAKPGEGKTVKLEPPAGWLSLIARQLTGK